MIRLVAMRMALAGAWLAGVALCAGLAVPAGAQAASGSEAHSGHEARTQVEDKRWRRLRAQRRHQAERAAAHARMPSTMYASTPDPAPPPHPAHVFDASPERALERRAARGSAKSTGGLVHRIALFPAAGDAAGRQGFARVVNRSGEAGEVRIEAWDDDGVMHGPVTLRLGAGKATHFNSSDLEEGNEAKGLAGATGAGTGQWRLALRSTLELDVLSYIRTGDGFLTGMHDVAPEGPEGHRVVIFNPGRNVNQVSRLRVVNAGEEEAEVRIEGTDDAGESPGTAVTFTLGAGASRTLSARELESGSARGLSGALGTGRGKWRLLVTSAQPLRVLSLLSSPTGHLTNLSSVAGESETEGRHEMPYFPAASRWEGEGARGFARVINRTGESGEVRIEGIDDAGMRRGPVRLTLEANEALHFNSADLEEGNAGKGLSGGIGAGSGDWRLEVRSTLELEVLSYIRTGDGFLTSMHDVAPEGPEGHRVVIFNPGRNLNQVSRLRVVNRGEEEAEVRIEGTDDAGASPGDAVTFTLAAGASRTLSARELESGSARGLSGALGTGRGKWRLLVTSAQPLRVLSLLSSPTGHLTNLSGVPAETESAGDVFRAHLSGPVVQAKCIACHVEGGISGHTRLVFVPSSEADHEARNLRVFEDFLDAVEDAATVILNKIQGVAHGGGVQVAAGTAQYANMERFLALLGEDVDSVTLTPETLFDTVKMAPARKTLRRAAIIFAGRNPTEAEYARVVDGDERALRATLRGLMTGPEFHEFLIRGANDRLLTDRSSGQDIINVVNGFYVHFVNEHYRRRAAAHASGDERQFASVDHWYEITQHGFRRAPLELIAHVVENDLPYTEILTADYIMANPMAAAAYGASTRFDNPEDEHEFKPSEIVSYYRKGDGLEEENDPVVGATRILNPGPLITDYPHAGILNTAAFLIRYPTTATNRNRARSRWTYYHFLGLDIEKSASRTTDPDALADTNNPTMFNPACTVCHVILDPVAGAFQNYGDEGLYKDQWGGLDSLDTHYKDDAGGPSLAIRAESWTERETLSWPVWMAAGVGNLRVLFTNPVYRREVYLDRLRVTDARGQVLVSREFEDLGPPVHPRSEHGHSCGATGRSSSGREDHVALWWGELDCAIYMDVEVPSDGVYNVEIVAWSNGYIETQYGEDGFAKLSVASNVHQVGDTWYRDMRTPGFADELAPNSDNSVQWLAQKIVADDRFAEAAVKFWWPAIMGREVAEPPEEEEDADFEGLLLAAAAQGAEVARLARGFRRGFKGSTPYNLKDLLVQIVLSKWFRADSVENTNPILHIALRDAGARRLLTPEELSRKTAAITGVEWGRSIGTGTRCWGECERRPSALTRWYRGLYGGIDSDGITKRARDLTSVMAAVAKTHATQMSCPIIMRELYLLPDTDRRLFSGIDRNVTPSRGADIIRNKLVELHDKLLGVQVTPYSPDVESAYQLFIEVWERKRASRDADTNFRAVLCDWWGDLSFYEGIADDFVAEYENENGVYHDFDWGRVGDFLHHIDWSDNHYAAQTWIVVLAYLMMDYRYLYL